MNSPLQALSPEETSTAIQQRQNLFSTNSDFFQYANQGSSTLFVWFGGINEPFFSSSFPERSGFDCLYFRDTNYDWYTQGLHGLTAQSSELVAALREEILPAYSHVCFGGQSSGGHAALYYGLACEADLCIVFSPQISNQFDGQCRMSPHVKIPNLYDLYRDAAATPKVVLNVGRSERDHRHEFEWNDLKQIDDFRSLDCVTLNIHPYDNHAISVKLREDGVLYDTLCGYVMGYKALSAQKRAKLA
ncbi:hypothetical protein ACS15_2519 [Ralstonia insidiosa]|uniref:Esterase n=1 Tax=Ralstonia insidiosa TaxID=190721 RepID=A0AAC9BDS6_9RALS|nr:MULTISPECIES: hypothetical protein [Ralstonia]ANH71895.1 hypothetical protein ACS15_2519 [Ralstonia insidiosa]EPX97036.1 hypothetical protein C404_16055 [Ralstonia sp. AU12-08]MBY4704888.1 hypothetical protein [Ralstonia insidiosa]